MKKVSLKVFVEFIIAYCNIHGFVITPMKLQKLLYYIQAWYLVKYERELLFDELPEAWVNGPVYRSVYNQYKDKFFRSTPLLMNRIKEEGESAFEEFKNLLDIEEKQIETITFILKYYSPMDESKLVLLTHSDRPWNIAREGYSDFDRCENEISVKSMYEFYCPKVN